LWYSQNEEEVSWRATNIFNENNGEQPNESIECDESVEYKDGLGRASVRNKIEGAIETEKRLEHLQEIKFVIRKGRFSARGGQAQRAEGRFGGNSTHPTNFGRNLFEFFRTHTASWKMRHFASLLASIHPNFLI
jgi:hypothetical protein